MGSPNYYDRDGADYVGGSGWGGLSGGGSSTATAEAPKPKSLEDQMREQAAGMEAEEKRRYEESLGIATNAYDQSNSALSKLIDPSLLFSRAADQIGARGAANLSALRSSLGSRGLNPNSGAAHGALSRMAFETNNSVVGATRDVEIENQRQRQVNAAVSFANAMNLANLTNAPVSGVGLETTQNLFEGQLTREGIKAQKDSNKSANKTNMIGGVIGGLSSLIGGLI